MPQSLYVLLYFTSIFAILILFSTNVLSYLRTPQEGLTEFVENYMEFIAINEFNV